MSFLNNVARDAASITPSDTVRIVAGAVYVGVAGNVRVLTSANTDITFIGVTAGSILPVKVVQVFSTSTTATNLIALTA
jgi:hypothetical protein